MKIRLFILIIITLVQFNYCGAKERDPNEVIFLLENAVNNIDPRKAASSYQSKIASLIFSGLTTMDTETIGVEFDLIESMENPDNLTYIFHLRQDVQFHDGQPLTAADVVFTYDSLFDEELQAIGGYKLEPILESYRAIDDYTVEFKTQYEYGPFLSLLTTGIVPEHILQTTGTAISPPDGNVIGSGPFKFDRLSVDRFLSLVKNDNYFNGPPKIDKLTFRFMTSDVTRNMVLMEGDADIAQNNIPFSLLETLENEPNLNIITGDSVLYTYLALNLEEEHLSNPLVRKAIAYAIDRDFIIERKFLGKARLSTGLLTPENWAYSEEVQTYPFNPEKAKELLDQAGYPDPDGDGPQMRFTLDYKTSTVQFRLELAEQIAHFLQEVGIGCDVRSLEWNELFNEHIRKRRFDIYSLQHVNVVEPDLYYDIFHSSNIPTPEEFWLMNRTGYNNPTIDQLLEDAQRTVDRAKRTEYYAQVQQILSDDLPYISLWHEDNIAVLNKRIENYQLIPTARFMPLKDITIHQE